MIDNYDNMDDVFEQIFGYKSSKRGKGFEMLAGAVLKIINEANDITHDVKKTGLFSTDSYQIDVLVDDNNESLFVEAKDYSERKSKTGRGDAQKLAGALNNLDIDKGLLISATGFTNPTVKYSQSTKVNPNAKEINLCLIRPANDKDTENLILEIVVDATFQMMDHSKSKANMPANVDLTNTVFIPVVNMDVSAGFGSLTEEIESTKDFVSFGKDWIKKHISANINNLVMFTVRGDSMDGGNSRIKNGSQIIVDTSVKEYINDGIYAIRIENALFVKRLQYMPGKLLVKSDNPIYQPFEVDLKTDSVNIIGAVVYVMNDMSCI